MFVRTLTVSILLAAAGTAIAAHTPGDLNGDGKADLLWRNQDSGANVVWLCDNTPDDGTFVTSTRALTSIDDDDWILIGRADFDGDDKVDLVFRHEDSGDTEIWYMNGTERTGSSGIPNVDDDWFLAGIADFNGDSKPDLLWRDSKRGNNAIWLMNNTNVLGSVAIPSVSTRAWHIEAAGDLTKDGKPDIVWRNRLTGATAVWEMNGTSVVASRSLGATVNDTRWRIADVMDFTGDSIPDIVWRNQATGANILWRMDGLNLVSSTNLPTVRSRDWYISGMDDSSGKGRRDDFEGNGRPTISWRHATNGSNVLWLMSDDDSVGRLANLPTVTDGNWRIVAKGDLNKDGKPDLLWRHQTLGDNVVWLMNGTTVAGTVTLPRVTGSWSIVGIDDCNDDDNSDIFWHNTATGQVVAWVLDGEIERANPAVLTLSLPSVEVGTQVVGVADYNDDDVADIFIRLPDNRVRVWTLNNQQVSSDINVGVVNSNAWNVGKISDFDDDKIPDILWRNSTTGANTLWILDTTDDDDSRIARTAPLPVVNDTAWRIED